MSTTNKKEYFKQNTKRNHNLLQTNTSHVTKAAGIEIFMIPKNESALAGTNRLVKDRSRKSGSI